MRIEVSDRPRGVAFSKAVRVEIVTTAIDVEKKTRQSIVKVQKVFGLEIS